MRDWKNIPINQIKSNDPMFPKGLLGLKKIPEKLYFRGFWDVHLFEEAIAIVGSRKMSGYGKESVEKFVSELAGLNINVISGFMYGVDSEVHRKTIEYGGKTIAVLGGGLDYLYPTENDQLYTEIIESGGLVISEYEPDFKPTLWSFPQRNRIVAALPTIGILVVEAGLKSGSLITAELGIELKRKIFAVPGPINSKLSQGTNWLIKEKQAKLVESAGDILQIDIPKYVQSSIFEIDLNREERQICSLLETEKLNIDEIAKKLKLPVSSISITITNMMLKNIVTEDSGKFVTKIKK